MDAGCELHGYSSDVTRTWPVSGTFTRHQREVYEIVLDTHRCVLNQQPFVRGRCLPAGTRSGSGAAAMPAHGARHWRLAVEVPRVHVLGMGLNMFLAQFEAPKSMLVRRWGNYRAGPQWRHWIWCIHWLLRVGIPGPWQEVCKAARPMGHNIAALAFDLPTKSSWL